MEALKAFWEQVQEREKMAAEIADDIFPVDFHIYAIKCPENCMMQIGVETVWQVIDGSNTSLITIIFPNLPENRGCLPCQAVAYWG